MSISSTNRKAGPFICDGSTTAFPFAFKVFSANDVRVVLTDSSSTDDDLTLTSEYTVALNANQDTAPGGAVTTTTAYTAGNKITLTSKIETMQPVEITNAGGFYPRVINDALDRLTILIQQLAERVSRSITVGIASEVSPSALIDALFNSSVASANSSVSSSASASAASESAAAAYESADAAAGSATSAAGSAAAAALSAAAALNIFGFSYVSGRYYLAGLFPTKSIGGGNNISAGEMCAVPFYVLSRHAVDINTVGITADTASGTASMRFALYADSNGAPGELIQDLGQSATTVTTTQAAISVSANLSLSAGTIYWIAFEASAAVAVTGIGASGATIFTDPLTNPLTQQSTTSKVSGSHTYGAAPANFPSVTYSSWSSGIARAYVRVA